MANDPILSIPQIAENQSNKYITHNNAVDGLAQAANRTLREAAVGAGPWTISEADFTRYAVFRASGASGAYEIRVPATIQTTNATKRVYIVANDDTVDTATLRTAGTGEQVVLLPGRIALVEQEGDDIHLLFSGSTVATDSQPYDFGAFIPGMPDDNGVVMIHIAARAFTLADDFAGARAWVGANPAATAVFGIEKNESAIGTISINTSGVATFATTGGAVSVAAGDRLRVTAPTPQDASLADVTITFKGTRV